MRGAQEEMFSKILQLQIAPNPLEIIDWMFEHGVDKTIKSYGLSNDELKTLHLQAQFQFLRWTTKLNNSIINTSRS